jgi:nucleoid DNA-binding protein
MNKKRLCETIQKHLGWEDDMVQSIVTTIEQAAVRNAVSELEDIMLVCFGRPRLSWS